MFRIGCHLSMSNGYLHMGEEAVSIGANTFQYFSRNPRGGGNKPFDPQDADAFKAFAKEHDIKSVLTHAPYTLNPCGIDPELRAYTLKTMQEDVERLEYFDEALYNFHPGSHVKQGPEIGIERIRELLNELTFEGMKTRVLLETMAGKGTEVGRNFDELSSILEGVRHPECIGVCMDTCHVSDGGYDITNDLDGVLREFDEKIGLSKLYALHINDSKNPLGAHKDRHEKIGEGFLGIETFKQVINHPELKEKPFFLETPQDLAGYKAEIALLKSLRTVE